MRPTFRTTPQILPSWRYARLKTSHLQALNHINFHWWVHLRVSTFVRFRCCADSGSNFPIEVHTLKFGAVHPYFYMLINLYIIQIYKELKISAMKTKSKNFVNRRNLYLSFGLFNQIRATIVTKNTTKIYFVLFMSALNSSDDCTDVLFDNHPMLCWFSSLYYLSTNYL